MTRDRLLETWRESVSVMHIAHHKTAARCTRRHNWIGGLATLLAAVVGASVFATMTDYAKSTGGVLTVAVGLVSMVSAGLTALLTFLKLWIKGGRDGDSVWRASSTP